MPALAIAAIAACAPSALPPRPAGAADPQAEYRLSAGDKVHIETYGEPTLTGDFVVAPNGKLDLPLIGAVPAGGKTTGELSAAITTALSQGYLRDPKVSVQALTLRPFYILGEVNKPGSYPFSPGMTVLSAVATAEGFTYRANQKRVFIRHMGSDKEEEVEVTAATPILPGDTIRIVERYF